MHTLVTLFVLALARAIIFPLNTPTQTRAKNTSVVLVLAGQILDALVSSSAGTAQLDLVCAYLKRVYMFVYYRAHQCRDEGDMVSSRGSCRSMVAPPKEEIQEVHTDHYPSACPVHCISRQGGAPQSVMMAANKMESPLR